MNLLTFVRGGIHGSDRRGAIADQESVYESEARKGRALLDRQAEVFNDGGEVGCMVDDAAQRPIRLTAQRLAGHALVVAPSGAGKSWLVLLLLRIILVALLTCRRLGIPAPVRAHVLDPKPELFDLARCLILDFADTLPPEEAEWLVSQVVCIDLFSDRALPALGEMLVPGDDPELRAAQGASLWLRSTETGVSFRQEPLWSRVHECFLRANLPTSLLPDGFRCPELFDALALQCQPSELFRSTAALLRTESRDRVASLGARADRLVRLRHPRLLLSAGGTDFDRLMRQPFVLCKTAPPFDSSTGLGKFLSGLTWLKETGAILRRETGAPPVLLIVDEFALFLGSASADVADSFDTLLRVSRSKGVFFGALVQDLQSLARVGASLPTTYLTNAHLVAFSRSTETGVDWSSLLPVTGCRPRPRGPAWEKARGGFLTHAEELTALRRELASLPDRVFYLADRKHGLPAVKVRTSDLLVSERDDTARLDEAAPQLGFVRPIEELARAEEDARRRLAALIGGRAVEPGGATPLRRVRRHAGIG